MMGMRFYDPQLGIFLQKDPFPGYVEDPTTLHSYMYTRNDPANKIDPLGEYWGDKYVNSAISWGQEKYNQGIEWLFGKDNGVSGSGAKAKIIGIATGEAKQKQLDKKKVVQNNRSAQGTGKITASQTIGQKINQGMQNLVSNHSPVGNWIEAATGKTLITRQSLSEEQRWEKVGKGLDILNNALIGLGTGGVKGIRPSISPGSVNVVNGMKLPTNGALDAAEDFLGKGYKDLGNGRFGSADGFRQVRMGDSDILGTHGGGPHMNFEILKPNPAKPGKMVPAKNYHIYLED